MNKFEKQMDEDFQYFKKELNLSCSFNELSEDMINNLIDSKLDVIDSKSEDSINDYLNSIGMLEWWLQVTKSTKTYKESFNEFLIKKYTSPRPV